MCQLTFNKKLIEEIFFFYLLIDVSLTVKATLLATRITDTYVHLTFFFHVVIT